MLDMVAQPTPQHQIRAIPTSYAGCRFRSRLEARWAVFFDAIGVPWEYEPEGVALASGWYLPDFALFGRDLWLEVKPYGFEFPARYRKIIFEFGDYLAGRDKLFLVLYGDIPRPGSDIANAVCMSHKLNEKSQVSVAELFQSLMDVSFSELDRALKAARSASFGTEGLQ